MHEHLVQFYETDDFLAGRAAAFLQAGLHAGDATIAIATERHLEQLQKRLNASGTALRAYYETLEAREVLEKIAVGDRVDAKRFFDVMHPLLARAVHKGNGHVRIYGELVALLWLEDRRHAAIELERLWNELQGFYPVALFCAYPIEAFAAEADGDPFLAICNEHTRVVPAESYRAPTNAHEHFRVVALLQQKAAALKTATARCKELERRLEELESRR